MVRHAERKTHTQLNVLGERLGAACADEEMGARHFAWRKRTVGWPENIHVQCTTMHDSISHRSIFNNIYSSQRVHNCDVLCTEIIFVFFSAIPLLALLFICMQKCRRLYACQVLVRDAEFAGAIPWHLCMCRALVCDRIVVVGEKNNYSSRYLFQLVFICVPNFKQILHFLSPLFLVNVNNISVCFWLSTICEYKAIISARCRHASE